MADDKTIEQAIRARILAEIERRSEASQVVNNVYSGGPSGGSVQERMGSSAPDGEDPFDYFVDIQRREVRDKDGNVIGWNKGVHRRRSPKEKLKLRGGRLPSEEV